MGRLSPADFLTVYGFRRPNATLSKIFWVHDGLLCFNLGATAKTYVIDIELLSGFVW
jgi:hypothetical protein